MKQKLVDEIRQTYILLYEKDIQKLKKNYKIENIIRLDKQ